MHQRFKPFIVVPLQQMSQFMHDDELQAFGWFFHEFQIKPNAAGVWVAAAPFGFHPFDADKAWGNTKTILPMLDEWFDAFAKDGSIPILQN